MPGLAGIDPRFAHITAEYGKRNYKVIAATPGTVTMERPSTKLNWFAVVGLTILFGVTVLLYLVPWAIWGIHRTYRATLSIGPSGEVEEFGDVLASYDRDRLVAHRVRCLGGGITAAVAGALMAVGGVGAALSPDTAAADRTPTLIVSLVVALILGGVAYLLFRTAQNTKRKTGSPPATATPEQPAAPGGESRAAT